MGEVREPLPVKLICGVLFRPEIGVEEILSTLERQLGQIEAQSPLFSFDYTSYYMNEMGDGLQKKFISFKELIPPNKISEIKLKTNEMESLWSDHSARSVNLDPGYITGAKLVLATTKNFAHRIYLENGIFGDMQLRYIHGEFVTHEWTYPDYQSENALTFFNSVRIQYNRQVKKR